MNEDHGDVWVCDDCYFAHHYGYVAGDEPETWFVGPDFGDAVQPEPLSLLDGFELSDNTCSSHNGDDEQGCSECGREGWEDGLQDFSRSSCDGCGSHLGGSRSRLHLWKLEETNA